MKIASQLLSTIIPLALAAASGLLAAYPLDGYEETGIRRVEGARLAHEGLAKGGKQPPGALLTSAQVDLRLLNEDMALPPVDPAFTAEVRALLGENAEHYGVAVLDLTDRDNPRYAEHRGDYRQNVGSVGKLLAALGLFQALADAWPDDLEQRASVLRNTVMTADNFSHSDHHTIRLFNVQTKQLTRRRLANGDQGSLWEYLDWMLSVSSNSAASMVMRDAMLLRHFGKTILYPKHRLTVFFPRHRKVN